MRHPDAFDVLVVGELPVTVAVRVTVAPLPAGLSEDVTAT